jgi:hypothetical protein
MFLEGIRKLELVVLHFLFRHHLPLDVATATIAFDTTRSANVVKAYGNHHGASDAACAYQSYF